MRRRLFGLTECEDIARGIGSGEDRAIYGHREWRSYCRRKEQSYRGVGGAPRAFCSPGQDAKLKTRRCEQFWACLARADAKRQPEW
jgi:hypothetical protein